MLLQALINTELIGSTEHPWDLSGEATTRAKVPKGHLPRVIYHQLYWYECFFRRVFDSSYAKIFCVCEEKSALKLPHIRTDSIFLQDEIEVGRSCSPKRRQEGRGVMLVGEGVGGGRPLRPR